MKSHKTENEENFTVINTEMTATRSSDRREIWRGKADKGEIALMQENSVIMLHRDCSSPKRVERDIKPFSLTGGVTEGCACPAVVVYCVPSRPKNPHPGADVQN